MSALKQVFSAPHRLYFAAAGVWLVVPMLWWGAFLYKRFTIPLVLQFNPAAVHGFGLLYGVFPLVTLGFLFTAFPKWTHSEPEVRKSYLGPWWVLLLGFSLYFGQLWIGQPWGSIGAFCLFCGLLWAWAHLLRLFLAGQGFEKKQPAFVLVAFFFGVVGSFCAFAFQLVPIVPLYQAALAFGVYLFWPLLLLSTLFRLLSFFTENKTGPIGMKNQSLSLPLWAFGLGLKTLGALSDFKELWVLSDAFLLAVTLWQFYHWRFFSPKKDPLVLYLYGALAWLPLAWVLGIAAGLDRLDAGYNLHWDLASLHCLTVGLMACLAYGMLVRVSLGHSGRPLKATGLHHFGYVMVQLAALSRVGIELALDHVDRLAPWLWVPAFFWLVGFGVLAFKLLPLYFQPRADQA